MPFDCPLIEHCVDSCVYSCELASRPSFLRISETLYAADDYEKNGRKLKLYTHSTCIWQSPWGSIWAPFTSGPDPPGAPGLEVFEQPIHSVEAALVQLADKLKLGISHDWLHKRRWVGKLPLTKVIYEVLHSCNTFSPPPH